jgi:predicted glycoside hydrolase/deacetylase ChbG (UPF0249 family)
MRIRHSFLALVFTLLLSAAAAAQIRSNDIITKLGYAPSSKLLIIHADDYGMAHSVDRAISEALEKRWVTSASIMVPCPWFPEAAAFAREHPNADLGIHLTLTSEWTTFRWGPIAAQPAPSLLDNDGYLPLTEAIAAQQDKPAEVENEIRAQIERAKAEGVRITHLDSHMGTLFQNQALFSIYQKAGRDLGVPNFIAAGSDVHGEHNFTVDPDRLVITEDLQMTPGVPKDKWLDAYKKMLTGLKPGVYQLIVHLGYDDAELQGITANHPDWGAAWRENDLKLVSSPEFHRFLKANGFILVSWRDLKKAMPTAAQALGK